MVLPRHQVCRAGHRSRGGGSIICTASAAGLRSGQGGLPDSASKAGVINPGAGRGAAASGFRGARHARRPGLIETGTTRPVFEAAQCGKEDRIGRLNPLRRSGLPEEVAHAALFLACAESSYVNGHALVVDGGLSSSHPIIKQEYGKSSFEILAPSSRVLDAGLVWREKSYERRRSRTDEFGQFGGGGLLLNPGTSEMQMVAAFDREARSTRALPLRRRGDWRCGRLRADGRETGSDLCRTSALAWPTAVRICTMRGERSRRCQHRRRSCHLPSAIRRSLAVRHRELAGPLSIWVESASTADDAPRLACEAVAASFGPPGGVATLILPADCAWTETAKSHAKTASTIHRHSSAGWGARIGTTVQAVRVANKPLLLMGGLACNERCLAAAGRLAATGIRVMSDTFVSRLPRGAGRFAPDPMPYFGEMAAAELAGTDLMLLAGTRAPVAFFAYPDKPSTPTPAKCRVETLSALQEDAAVGSRSAGRCSRSQGFGARAILFDAR